VIPPISSGLPAWRPTDKPLCRRLVPPTGDGTDRSVSSDSTTAPDSPEPTNLMTLGERGNYSALKQAPEKHARAMSQDPVRFTLRSRTIIKKRIDFHCFSMNNCGGFDRQRIRCPLTSHVAAPDMPYNNNKNNYLVWPQRGTWLHRPAARRANLALRSYHMSPV
jgi:hypothetical protein